MRQTTVLTCGNKLSDRFLPRPSTGVTRPAKAKMAHFPSTWRSSCDVLARGGHRGRPEGGCSPETAPLARKMN